MRYAILSDIHSNLTALEAVLVDIDSLGGVGEIWCLGDIVGYGPDPHECIELVRKKSPVCIAGNHDWAAEGKVDTAEFNPDAGAAAIWTRSQLTPDEKRYLENLPLVLEKDIFTLARGSPRHPVWEYILSADTAAANFDCFQTACCLVGHSHVPAFFEQINPYSLDVNATPAAVPHELHAGSPVVVGGRRLIINPGSVGQPRDNDPRSSYMIYDDEAGVCLLKRVPYNISPVQQRMLKAGLPTGLIERLAYGY